MTAPYRDLDHYDAHMDALCEQEPDERGDEYHDRFIARVRESAASASLAPALGQMRGGGTDAAD